MRLLRKKSRPQPEGERGFTLIETTIALGVMMIAAFGVASLFLYSIQNNAGAGDRAVATAIAQQRLERLRSVGFDALADENTSVVSHGRSYSVATVVTVVDTDDDDAKDTLKRIEVRVTPQAAGGDWAGGAVVLWTERAALGLGDNR